MLNIELTKEEVLEHIEIKLVEALEQPAYQNEYGEYRGGTRFTPLLMEIIDSVSEKIKNELWAEEKKSLQQRIQQTIDAEMQKILYTTYQPVDQWGDKKGEPTTIRELFVERTKDFWLQKVDANGKASDNWSGKMTRAEFVAKSQLESSFKEVLNSEIAIVVNGFRDALSQTLKGQAAEQVEAAIKKLIVAK